MADSKRTGTGKGRSSAAGGRKPRKTSRAERGTPQVVGSIFERTYKGVTLRVRVGPNGYVFKRKTYPSLTAVAKAITGYKSRVLRRIRG